MFVWVTGVRVGCGEDCLRALDNIGIHPKIPLWDGLKHLISSEEVPTCAGPYKNQAQSQTLDPPTPDARF